jgi:hypothetical protein
MPFTGLVLGSVIIRPARESKVARGRAALAELIVSVVLPSFLIVRLYKPGVCPRLWSRIREVYV